MATNTGSNHTPSMLALLGLLAVAGYQNRDKIAAALGGLGNPGGGGPVPGVAPAIGNAPAAGSGAGALGSLLGNLFGGGDTQATPGNLGGLSSLLSGLGGSGSNVLSGGLGGLMKSFEDAGHGAVAKSWVDPSVPTQATTPEQVEQAIGGSNIDALVQQTGLSRDELLKRLATAIPQTVDKLTPNGQMPDEKQALRNLAA